MFPYDVFGRGVDFTRERMILRHWQFPVHECFQFAIPPRGVEDQRVVVQHLPSMSKTGSNERNLRIIESMPREEMTPGMLFHLHGELLGAGRVADSVEAAKQAIANKDIGKPETYEIFLNLGCAAQEPKTARAYFHQAYATDPCRREALGLLTASALDYGQNAEALALQGFVATLLPLTNFTVCSGRISLAAASLD
jgi:hypothetical protein